MERNQLFNLKKSLEKALRIVEGEMENATSFDTECDSKGFAKPKIIYAGNGTVEWAMIRFWDEIPEEFTVKQLREIIKVKLKTESTPWGRVARRSLAAFSVVLCRWVGDGYLNVRPDSGRYPHTYFKIRKNGPTAPGTEKA